MAYSTLSLSIAQNDALLDLFCNRKIFTEEGSKNTPSITPVRKGAQVSIVTTASLAGPFNGIKTAGENSVRSVTDQALSES